MPIPKELLAAAGKAGKKPSWPLLAVAVLELPPLLIACTALQPRPSPTPEPSPTPQPTPTVEGPTIAFSPPTPEPTPTKTSTPEPSPTPQPTPTVEGPTIVGETLAIGGAQLELVTTPGDQLAQQIGARERGWAVVTDENGNSSFFTGYAGPTGKEVQTVVLAQGPQGFEWDGENMIWKQNNQVVIPDILLPGGWNEEKQIAGPAHEADKVFLFVDKTGNFQVGVVYGPEKMAGIPDKSNLTILPDGSGLFVSDPKNYQLEEGQEVRREEGNLRLINPDGSYLLMRTSWENVTSPDQLYQAGVFAGPIEAMPEIPYPPETFINELGIKNPEQIAFSVIGEKPVMTQNVVDDKGNEQEIIVAQATTNEEGQFKGWQTTVPLAAETGLVVPDPRATNPELFDLTKPDAPIPQFVKAMQMAGIEARGEEVLAGLHPQLETHEGLPPFVTYRTSDGIALMITAENPQTGEWEWKQATVGEYWKNYGKYLGYGLKPRHLRKYPEYFNNRYFQGGILALTGALEDGGPVGDAAPFLRLAEKNNMAFLMSYLLEPGKFPNGVTPENIDTWLINRLREMAKLIEENNTSQAPVFVEINEPWHWRKPDKWNPDANPLQDKYGNGWLAEAISKVIEILTIEGSLKYGVDYYILVNDDTGLTKPEKLNFIHRDVSEARKVVLERYKNELSTLNIQNENDLPIIVGFQIGEDNIPIDVIKTTASQFADLGGIFLTEINPRYDQEGYLKAISELKTNPNIRGFFFWKIVPEPDPDEADDHWLLFLEKQTPTVLYYQLLR